jgi:hypothetical protein
MQTISMITDKVVEGMVEFDVLDAARPEAVDGVGQCRCLREQIAPVGQDHLAEGVIRTGLGPPGRSKTAPPTARSSAAICWLTYDWVQPSRAAARPTRSGAIRSHSASERRSPNTAGGVAEPAVGPQ